MRKAFFCLSLLLCSCNELKKEVNIIKEVTTIKVDPTERKDLNPNDIFEKISYLKLNFPDGYVISKISKIRVKGDTLILLSAQSIALIDKNGNFISKIERRGKGPGEYIELSDLLIDGTSSLLEVLDEGSGKIIKYDFQGNYIDEWKNDNFLLAKSFFKVHNDLYAVYGGVFFYGKAGHRLIFISKNTEEIIGKYFPIGREEQKFQVFIESNNFQSQDSGMMFHYSFQDTVFLMQQPASLKPYLKFDFGKHHLPASVLKGTYKDVLEFISYCRETDYAYQASNLLETNNIIFFNFEYLGERHQGYYSKASGKTKVVRHFKSDLNFSKNEHYFFLKYPLCVHENEFIFYLEPYMLINYVNNARENMSTEELGIFLDQNKELVEISESLNENGPLILIKAKLKDF